MRKLLRWVTFVLLAAFLWMLFPLDGLANHYLRSNKPEFHRHGSGSKTAVVFFTGVQSSAVTHSAGLLDVWGEHGDVIVVEYNRNRFDGAATAYTTYGKLVEWDYERAILIGASKGGLVATDVIDFDRAGTTHLEYAVIAVDTPQDESDLQRRDMAELTQLWHPGPLTSLVFTWVFWSFAFDPPPAYMHGEGVDQQQLKAHYQASRTYPLSGWTGGVRYIFNHRGFMTNQYAGIPFVAMQSEHDKVVKPSGEKWKVVFGGGTIVKVGEASHVDFVQHPQEWEKGFRTGFAALPAGW